MYSLIVVLLLFSCNQEKNLITNKRIGKYKLGEQFMNDFDEKIFGITSNSSNRIRSIIVRSNVYKTKEGFGVGSNLNAIQSFYKGTIKKPLTLSKGAVIIGSLGTGIFYDSIIFVDDDKDDLVDFVWIQTE